MAKTYLGTVKYVIKTSFTIEGIVDKHDIIGAIFGQSEGLIGEEMDLKELQKNGKLGRIEVESETKSGKTVGDLIIPSSLDRVQTSILAAAIESVDKVGPCTSIFDTISIEDARQEKRKVVTDRARELLLKMKTTIPETQELTEQIRDDARTAGLIEIGIEKIAIGPEAKEGKEIILVEGRADVINLLKHGIKNVAGVGGAKVPRTIVNLVKDKEVTVFVDGDRGGDIIARQLVQAIKVDFVAKAPDGKEVEELTLKEILASLRKKMDSKEAAKFSSVGPRSRSFRTEEPETGYRSERPRSRFREERPSNRFREERPSTEFRSERPRTGFREERPSTEFRSERPNNRFREERPSTEFRSERPRTGFREERPRPTNRFREERPSRGEERPSFRGPPRSPRPSFGGRDRPREESRREITITPNDLGSFSNPMKELEGSLKARLLDEKLKVVKELNVRDLLKEIEKHKNVSTIVLDGIVTKRLLDQAEKYKIKQVVGVKKGRIQETEKVKVSTLY